MKHGDVRFTQVVLVHDTRGGASLKPMEFELHCMGLFVLFL